MKTLKNLEEVKSFIGSELGVSKWHQISQSQISKFGKVTGDEQWIHTAPVRAKLLSPFKSTDLADERVGIESVKDCQS